MENFAPLVSLVVLIPLGGLLINLFLGKNLSEKGIGFVASASAGLAFAVAVILTITQANFGYHAAVVSMPIIPDWITIPSANVEIPWQFRIDTLSLTMMLVVTGVGTLIHIYAIGYMHGDPRFQRFFVYLNLFLVFMLVLVSANNYLMTFVGWEGVGLCSFLLIGFWFDKTRGEGWRNSDAARKAFIVNRVGDFGFILAIFLTFWTFGTLDYYKPGEVVPSAAHSAPAGEHAEAAPAGDEHAATTTTAAKGVFGQAEDQLKENRMVQVGPFTWPLTTVLTIITLLILVGVTGKSAQIPLFVWLPDAMAGPTPVSALIHAATMVTAGIFVVTRSNVFFQAAPLSAALVTLIGATTGLMAGFIALGQWDIKRVLAYSTVSQLGFMVAAIGLGGYVAGMFHLITHAFFKALLFLGSGSVIHGVEHGHHLAHAHGHGGGGGHGEGHTVAHEDEAHHSGAHGGHDEEQGHAGEVFDPQDMRNMGGLRTRMPVTFWTYLIGTLALAGIFPLAGFWSKDEILAKAFSAGFNDGKLEGYIALGLLLAAAGFTAFYMWRQICMVFLGQPRTEAAAHAPESNSLMTVPLIILAILSALGGLLNIPTAFESLGFRIEILTLWLEHSVTYAIPGQFNALMAITALVIAIGAIVLAHQIYGKQALTKKGRDQLEKRAETRELFRLSNAKLYWDEVYFKYIVYPFQRAGKWLADVLDWKFWHDYVHNTLIGGGFNGIAAFLSSPVDKGAIDQGFMSLGRGVEWAAGRLRRLQTGYVRTYAFTVLLGVLFVLLLILLPLIRR